MATERIGSHPSHKFQVVESITEAKSLAPIDSGKVFVFDQASYTITLPKLSTEIAGWHTKLARRSHAAGVDVILSPYSGDEDTLWIIESESTGGDTEFDLNKGADILTIVANDGTSNPTDIPIFLDITTDGTRWFIQVFSKHAGFAAVASG